MGRSLVFVVDRTLEVLVVLDSLAYLKIERQTLHWAMTMVKLPDLEFKEVERVVEALEHYVASLQVTQSADASDYARLAEMLDRRLKAQRGRAVLNELAPVSMPAH